MFLFLEVEVNTELKIVAIYAKAELILVTSVLVECSPTEVTKLCCKSYTVSNLVCKTWLNTNTERATIVLAVRCEVNATINEEREVVNPGECVASVWANLETCYSVIVACLA